MNADHFAVAIAAAVAFAATAATVPLAIRLGLWLGVTSAPSSRTLKVDRIPAIGGISIIAGLLAALALVGQLSLWIGAGAVALLVVGLIDDAFVLRPYQKLAAQILVAAWAVTFALPHVSLTPWQLTDFALITFWLISCSNAFNLVDGLDGLATGIGVVASIALAAVGALRHDFALLTASAALGGALCGFLAFNFPPASIFMGDTGALPIGFVLGALALQGGAIADNTRLAKYVFPILVMLVPLLDTAIVSVTRLATSIRVSRHSLDHSHHRLLALGLNDRQVALVTWTVAGLGAVAAIATVMLPHELVLTELPFFILGAATIALFMMDLTFDLNSPSIAYGKAQRLARFILNLSYKRRMAEALVDFALIAAAYFGAWLLRKNFQIELGVLSAMLNSLPLVALLTYVAFFTVGIYRGIWRYTGASDLFRFANGAVLAGVLIAVGAKFFPISASGSIVVLHMILLFNLLVITRLSFQGFRKGIAYLATPDERVLVIGAGDVGAAAANFVVANRKRAIRLVGFVDDDGFKQGKLVHGQQVLGSLDDLDRIYGEAHFEQLVVAADLSDVQLCRLGAFASEHKISLRRFSMRVSEVTALATSPETPGGATLAPTSVAGG